jgi:hypothetical protein
MTANVECPFGVVGEALDLSSRIEVRGIPEDFDPGGISWTQTLSLVAQQFSNHEVLIKELHQEVAESRHGICEKCRATMDDSNGNPCKACKERFLAEHRLCEVCAERCLAEHRLWEAALEAAERGYQRWLARRALRRAAERKA